MKIISAFFLLIIVGAGLWFMNDKLAPLFLNSRLERLFERNLPKLRIEKGYIACCRMKADDFRFPLPPGSQVTNVVISGGFDTVDGRLDALLETTNQMSTFEYQKYMAGKVPIGGDVSVSTIPGGLRIKFHYFGDK